MEGKRAEVALITCDEVGHQQKSSGGRRRVQLQRHVDHPRAPDPLAGCSGRCRGGGKPACVGDASGRVGSTAGELYRRAV